MTKSFPEPNLYGGQIAIANLLALRGGSREYRFQNFFSVSTVDYGRHKWGFLPFAFTGITFNRSGENSQSEIILPNRLISRQFVNTAVSEQWTAKVQVMMVTDIEAKSLTNLYTYFGQVSGGAWKASELIMTLSGILDAVEANVPLRNYDIEQIGQVPISGNISL